MRYRVRRKRRQPTISTTASTIGSHDMNASKLKILMERLSDGSRVNERGNNVIHCFAPGDRYQFDFRFCQSSDGWRQFDTDQDAWYFGMWVHMEGRVTVTYAEGDIYYVECPTPESFRAELAHAVEFYGEAPPAAIAYDMDGTRTEYYDSRPSPEEVSP